MSKICCDCKSDLSIIDFYPDKNRTSELRPYCKKCNTKRSSNWRIKNPDKNRNAHFKRRYNLTIERYKKMHESQKGLCAICGREEIRLSSNKKDITPLCVDHNHNTGLVRDLLCYKCNTVLGYFEENIKYFQNAINYLQQHRNLHE